MHQHKLPRSIVTIFEEDLLNFIPHTGYGISYILRSCLNWIVRTIEKAIKCKKDEIKIKCLGAIIAAEPKYFWILIIQCPYDSDDTAITKDKFNSILADVVEKRQNHKLLDINSKM